MRVERWWKVVVACAAAASACSDEPGQGAGSASSTSSTGAAAGATGSGGDATGAAGGAGGEPSAGGQGVGGGAASGTGGAGGSTSSSGTGGRPDLCPAEPGDAACDTCLKASCCPELGACDVDPVCVCWRDCMEGGDIGKCFTMCGDPSDATSGLGQCGNAQCVAACPQFS